MGGAGTAAGNPNAAAAVAAAAAAAVDAELQRRIRERLAEHHQAAEAAAAEAEAKEQLRIRVRAVALGRWREMCVGSNGVWACLGAAPILVWRLVRAVHVTVTAKRRVLPVSQRRSIHIPPPPLSPCARRCACSCRTGTARRCRSATWASCCAAWAHCPRVSGFHRAAGGQADNQHRACPWGLPACRPLEPGHAPASAMQVALPSSCTPTRSILQHQRVLLHPPPKPALPPVFTPMPCPLALRPPAAPPLRTVEQRSRALKAAKIRYHPDKAAGTLEVSGMALRGAVRCGDGGGPEPAVGATGRIWTGHAPGRLCPRHVGVMSRMWSGALSSTET